MYIPEIHERNRDDTDQKMNSSPNADCQKPEPKEDVNFFVDNVNSKDAETVLVFNCARRTIVVEGTLGHLDKK